MSNLKKIISGSQTGANRAGLDAAIELDIPVGDWCPKGRKSEDRPIDEKYSLQETASGDYRVRKSSRAAGSGLEITYLPKILHFKTYFDHLNKYSRSSKCSTCNSNC